MPYIPLIVRLRKRPRKGAARDASRKRKLKACGLISIESTRYRHGIDFKAVSTVHGVVGELRTVYGNDPESKWYEPPPKETASFLDASTSKVYPNLTGCGIGTRMYEAAAAAACVDGVRLRSDRTRTEYSESFWKKQVKKRRAKCVENTKLDKGMTIKGNIRKCRFYVLNKCHTDLSGVRSRKRRGK